MGHEWRNQLVTLVFTIYFCQCTALQFNDGNTDIAELDYLPEEPELIEDELQKRFSKFVRIGRGLSSFIRIGRNYPTDGVDLYRTDGNNENEIGGFVINPDNGAVLGYTPNDNLTPVKRYSSFVRIGRNYGKGDDNQGPEFTKRGGAFIRMGKFPSSAFIRGRGEINEYTEEPYYHRTGRIGHSSFIRIGKRDTKDALKRIQHYQDNSNLNDFSNLESENYTNEAGDQSNSNENTDTLNQGIKYDTDYEEDEGKGYLRISRQPEMEEKRMSNFVRIGKGVGPDDLDKAESDDWNHIQYSSDEKRLRELLGLEKGNSFSDDADKDLDTTAITGEEEDQQKDESKRFSSFVRIGKSTPALDKRFSSFVRIGKSYDRPSPLFDKRFSSFVRIGKRFHPMTPELDKRYSSFVRIGKNASPTSSEFDKRYSSFVRIGKNASPTSSEFDKRYSSFVRIGKGSSHDDPNADKRFSKFVRIGKSSSSIEDDMQKRYSSFVRIGKSNQNEEGLESEPNKRMSQFVRIGKNYFKTKDELNKRLSSFIRVGKAYPDESNGMEKRFSKFVRIGKNKPTFTSDKRGSSFVRIGKATDALDDRYNKRLSSFIRVGKNTKENLPGTNSNIEIKGETQHLNKRALSTFVRIGKDNGQDLTNQGFSDSNEQKE